VTEPKVCKDCAAEWGGFPPPARQRRPAPNPGPRCATHWREERDRRKKAAHEKRSQRVYGLGDGDYDRIYAHQDGRCPLCRRATGKTRKLSVDHDHKTLIVRGLLCRPCNTLLGHARDDPQFFDRAKDYLLNPPALAIGTFYAPE
jgi:hypothetical protein